MGKRERQSDKKKQVWISVALSLLMILSAFGVLLGSFTSGDTTSYGKYNFEYKNNQFYTKINGKEMPFYFPPQQTDYINLSSSVANKLKESYFIMITFNPKETANLNIMELVRFELSQYPGKLAYSGVLNLSEQYPDLNILDCSNATLLTPVIVLNISDNTSIVDIDNCIYMNGRGTELLRLRDRLLYSYFGVINDN
jgi:hypothetical protein